MIDLNHPNRIRVLKETGNGIVVTTDLTEPAPESKLVLQAALGMDASQSFLVAERNLVVEGVDDYWILTELSNLLQRSGKEGLPEDVLITPAGGASTAVHIATIMIGQNSMSSPCLTLIKQEKMQEINLLRNGLHGIQNRNRSHSTR